MINLLEFSNLMISFDATIQNIFINLVNSFLKLLILKLSDKILFLFNIFYNKLYFVI